MPIVLVCSFVQVVWIWERLLINFRSLFHYQNFPKTTNSQKIKNPPSPHPDNDVEAEGNTVNGNVG